MPPSGWKQLVAGAPWFEGEDSYPIIAYSEFVPPPRLGRKPYAYAAPEPPHFKDNDPWGWPVTEYEEASGLRPGLAQVGQQIVKALVHLGRGELAHGIAQKKLEGNPCWPPELAQRAGNLPHERYVVLLPLALSRTQDDKGRVRWTVFGNSEQGPARAFWKGFFTSPKQEMPQDQALTFIRRLLHEACGAPDDSLQYLHGAGFRILPQKKELFAPCWEEGALPSWTGPYLHKENQPVRDVKYLLTFRPFAQLPAAVKSAYLAGNLQLLPFPGSLVFWGAPPYLELHRQLPFAIQVPLLHMLARHENPFGLRVPQSGWLHEPRPGHTSPSAQHGPLRNTYKRTHRWARVLRDQDELALIDREDKLLHVLFSSIPDDLGLYDKPMARNVQLWTHDFRLLLDGPHASHEQLKKAMETVMAGGLFGYRFVWPAMRVGRHEVYWHRPLVAYLSQTTGEPALLPEANLGYLTAYRADRPVLDRPIELWPRLLQRESHLAAIDFDRDARVGHVHQTTRNVRKLLDTWELLGKHPLPRSFARQLLTCAKQEPLENWLKSLNVDASGAKLVGELRQVVDAEQAAVSGATKGSPPESLTYDRTAQRSFEVAYWKTIAQLAESKYLNKNNADCVRDPLTQRLLTYPHRDLDALGDYLLEYYRKAIADAEMTGKALAGEVPFVWRTDFDFSWMGGWLDNQEGKARERDLLIVIPGRDRKRAVIMADHYDTAYMEDRFAPPHGPKGARIAACGADDNASATAALMLAAPVFLDLSRARKLDCDIWLVHLTGEEFPADCLGARQLTQRLVEGTLELHQGGKARPRDLSGVQVQGVYVLDMVAHNNDREHDIFQITPGNGSQSMWLAYQAHLAAEIWNASVPFWNRKALRRCRGRGRRSPHGGAIPSVAEHPVLSGEVRPPYDPHSTLYNTDGQIFSDAGVPVVLFMENYDINRIGYHDTHDTMANIDLDYGSALTAITIESVARAATENPGNT